MNHIKRLKKLLENGKIDAQEYKEQLQELLDDQSITQEEFDGAKDFEPQGKEDELIYSQEDVNRMITSKARKIVKKALTDAGVDVEGVDGKEIVNHFAQLAVTGQKKGKLDATEEELNTLRRKAKAYDDLQPSVKSLSLENAILKAAGELKPHNPKQVVRALSDYENLLEYDENEVLVSKSVDRALKKLAEAEPNLFQTADNPGGGAGNNQENNFAGKPPGGTAGGGTGGGSNDQKYAANKAKALEYLGIKKD